ncbi:MAG: GvpL/GvpF family gas vesicle protein, partial [Elusimicrobia bacterium]|nr:GvpL/GvpF family gas vesicle protein [Elusimicrobiota bacterium]
MTLAHALYLYCIREKTDTPPPASGPGGPASGGQAGGGDNTPVISTEGIDGKGEVFTLIHRRLEAVVSRVSLKEFGSGEVQKKAREDLVWIQQKALLHQKVIEAAAKNNDTRLSLIPMRFGIIFNGEKSLKTTLDKDYARITEKMEKIRGKQEWGLKVYLKNQKSFEERIKEKNMLIKKKLEELANLPEGEAFFMEEELNALVVRETAKELNDFARGVFETFKNISDDCVKNKNLGKELTGRAEPMVLNAAYLIPGESVPDFKTEAEKVNKRILEKGFYLEYSGPWPAYNFAAY